MELVFIRHMDSFILKEAISHKVQTGESGLHFCISGAELVKRRTDPPVYVG
jgi:hypothetical protein